jgi:hypothetical protein
MKRYDYMIKVERAIRPLRGLPFIATFSYFYELTDGPDKRITPPVAEAWGNTEAEAREKLQSYIDGWKKSQE